MKDNRLKKYMNELIEVLLEKKLDKKRLTTLKIKLCKKYKIKDIPTDIQVLLHAKEEDLCRLKHLQSKPVRTKSGVAVVAVMTKPRKCPHGRCITCPGGPDSVFGDMPQSYTGKEPATRRALRNNFDGYLQVFNRLEQYIATGHLPDKIELIIMGGTFPAYPRRYQEEFVKNCFKAMNDFSKMFFKKNEIDIIEFKRFFELPGDIFSEERRKSVISKVLKEKNKGKSSLLGEQRRNEKAKVRCVGLTIETRPDYGGLKEANFMLKLGCTRVELGVQSVYNKSLRLMERGHTVEETVESLKILKDLGFKINYHYMPGLFVGNKEDIEGMKLLFSDSRFKPDMIKIYPVMVMKGTRLYGLWKKGKFKPLKTKEAIELIAKFKSIIPKYCRVMRVQRDIPTYMTEDGVDRTNLRQYVKDYMHKKGMKCECIRCREIGGRKVKKIEFGCYHYSAQESNEFFISAESDGYLLGFCRLRFPKRFLRKEIDNDTALLRELHVYGTTAEIGGKGEVQHKGIGKELLRCAELTALTYNRHKMVVISGVGVRSYYRKLGYKQDGVYMVKRLG